MNKTEEYKAWWKEVNKLMWNPGTRPDHRDVMKFDPLGKFLAGWSVRAFVYWVDKELGHPQGYPDSATWSRETGGHR